MATKPFLLRSSEGQIGPFLAVTSDEVKYLIYFQQHRFGLWAVSRIVCETLKSGRRRAKQRRKDRRYDQTTTIPGPGSRRSGAATRRTRPQEFVTKLPGSLV